MEFEPVNVHGDAAKQAEMEALGIPRVPATVLGGDFVHGWNPAGLAALVGVDYDGRPAMSPAELAQSQDNILYYTQHLVKGLTIGQLALKHPERDRTLRNLAFHVFRLSAAFVDAQEKGWFLMEWLTENAPEEMQSGPQLAEYGQEVRDRLMDWFGKARPRFFERIIETYYGEQDTHLLLERSTWHAGQHLRQIHDLLRRNGDTPSLPLPEELFEGLPMPEELW